MNRTGKALIVSLSLVVMIACAQQVNEVQVASLPEIDISAGHNGIVKVPDTAPAVFRDNFVKYTKLVAPNGKPIHFLVRDGWSDDQILKARNVLEHILRDAPGTRFGQNKTEIANALADRNATMVLIKNEADLEIVGELIFTKTDLSAQDLRANETPAEGSTDYMNHITRDASFEEILHLVHDYGIRPVLPEYDEEIDAVNDALVARGVWEPWPHDEPDSHRNEYIAVVYDNYLDLWAVEPKKYEGRPLEDADIPDGTSHFGVYSLANNRSALLEHDPEGYGLVEDFFPPYLTYTPLLPEDFEGTFSMTFDPEQAYTYKSQHLMHATLRGAHDSNLRGNQYDNRLTGNRGDNELNGGPGDDSLDGGAGIDIAIFSRPADEYEISDGPDGLIVTDTHPDRGGRDVLMNIERLRFFDGDIEVRQ